MGGSVWACECVCVCVCACRCVSLNGLDTLSAELSDRHFLASAVTKQALGLIIA